MVLQCKRPVFVPSKIKNPAIYLLDYRIFFDLVPRAGLEPAQCFHRGILNPLRLPISPPGHLVSEFFYHIALSIFIALAFLNIVRNITIFILFI